MSGNGSGVSEGEFLPKTSPKYPEPITDPICVACGKTTGQICVCYGCRRRISGKENGELESELVKAYTRGRAAEYWNGESSLQSDSDCSKEAEQ